MDWDNTLRRGFTIRDWSRFLVHHDAFSSTEYALITEIIDAYANKQLSYEDLSEQAPSLYAKGIQGQDCNSIAQLAQDFVDIDHDNLFPFVKPLIARLQDLRLSTVIVSGCPIEVLRAYNTSLSWTSIFGVKVHTHDGHYESTLTQNPAGINSKQMIVDQLDIKSDVVLALGDSQSDLPLLNAARCKVVIDNYSLLADDAAIHIDPRVDPDQIIDRIMQQLRDMEVIRQ